MCIYIAIMDSEAAASSEAMPAKAPQEQFMRSPLDCRIDWSSIEVVKTFLHFPIYVRVSICMGTYTYICLCGT